MFHISDPKDIKSGRTTDVYFTRTVEILKKGHRQMDEGGIFATHFT